MIKNIFTFLLFVFIAVCGSAEQVQFNVSYIDDAESGFYDPTYGTARQNAFEYACGIWSDYLGASYAEETIYVSASFTDLGGTSSSATLGGAGPSIINSNSDTDGYWANAANANHLTQTDINPDTLEIHAQFNSAVDNSTVLGSRGFYYGLDGNCGSDIDFATVLLHELGHGLGFTPLIDSETGAYTYSGIPSLYDYFIALNTGTDYTPLTGMTDTERLSAITSDDLYWLGGNAVTANDGNPVKIYAPTDWEQGSSVSHQDEGTYPDALMGPHYSGVVHSPDALTLGMLTDLGWDVIPEPSTMMLLASFGVIALFVRRRLSFMA